jgi:hypothetical protein
MNRFCWLGIYLGVSLLVAWSMAAEPEKDVPWKAQAEIARRGGLVERIDGVQDANDPVSAISAALQPPADDSHKWLFTLVTMKNCQWCDKLRSDFENDPKLKAWVDTKEYTKSWAHWQVVQSEDKSQEWRWKDFRPTQFPTLIVQPPVNGSWGDPHTIVFVRQGYIKPDELDTAIRKAIQLYAAKTFPRHLAWESKQGLAPAGLSDAGFQQGGAEQSGGWTPPVTPPSPLPSLPNVPPQTYPPSVDPTAVPGGLTIPLSLPSLSTILLLLTAVSNVWMLYREVAEKVGVKLLLTDEQAKKLVDLLPKQNSGPSPPASAI